MAVLVALVFIGTGCVSDIINDIEKIKARMLRSSIQFCTSQLAFDYKQQRELYARIGIEDGGVSFNSMDGIYEYWGGILRDPEFREYLKSIDKDPIEFQEEITWCQDMYLEREGYYDFIRPY